MFSNIIHNSKAIPSWTRYINQASYKSNRFFSAKPTAEQNFPPTLFQQSIQRERNYVLPFFYLIQSPGKLISSTFVDGVNKWLEVPEEKVHEIKDLSQSLHHSTLLIDDILDKSAMRRSLPAANTIFSVENTLTAANFIYFLVMSAAHELGHPDAQHVIVKNLLDCHRGQATEIYWSENRHIPTLEEYEECVVNKTTSAYWVPIRLMELFSKKKYDFEPLMNAFARYFQIRDDYNDLIGADHTTPSDDITSGRYTYLIIHALRNNPNDYQINRILQLKTTSNVIKKYLVSMLDKYGSIEHTRVLLCDLEMKFRDEIRKLGGNEVLEELADYLNSSGNYRN